MASFLLREEAVAEISPRATTPIGERGALFVRAAAHGPQPKILPIGDRRAAVLAVYAGRKDPLPALRLACELAIARRHRLVVLRVLPLDLHSVSGPRRAADEVPERDRVDRVLASLRHDFAALPRIEIVVAYGAVRPMIAECAARHDAAAIVRFARGNWLRRLLRRPPRLVVEPVTPPASRRRPRDSSSSSAPFGGSESYSSSRR